MPETPTSKSHPTKYPTSPVLTEKSKVALDRPDDAVDEPKFGTPLSLWKPKLYTGFLYADSD